MQTSQEGSHKWWLWWGREATTRGNQLYTYWFVRENMIFDNKLKKVIFWVTTECVQLSCNHVFRITIHQSNKVSSNYPIIQHPHFEENVISAFHRVTQSRGPFYLNHDFCFTYVRKHQRDKISYCTFRVPVKLLQSDLCYSAVVVVKRWFWQNVNISRGQNREHV